MTKPKKTPRQLAEEHVEWFINILVPIIRRVGTEEFVHGYKHGERSKKDKKQ